MMSATREGRVWTPLIACAAFAAFTLILYVAGPLDWPLNDLGFTLLIVGSTWFAIFLGYWVGVRTIGSPAAGLQRATHLALEKLLLTSLVLNFATLPVAVYGYTGQTIGSLSFDLAAQGDVYLERYRYLTDGGVPIARLAAAALRALSAPVIFGGIILGLRYWVALSPRYRLILVGSLLCQVTFSFARGTDKETFDLMIFATVALMAQPRGFLLRHRRHLVVAAVAILLVFGLFISRRESRAVSAQSVCYGYSGVCLDQSADSTSLVGRLQFGYANVAGYLTQGYHGLALTKELDHIWTQGVGSVPPLGRVLALFSFGDDPSNNTYAFRLSEFGWDSRFRWSTMYAQIANDVTFAGVPLVGLVAGYFLGRMWRRSLRGDAAAYIVACYLILALLYASANNQLFSVTESLVAFSAWSIVAWVRRSRPLTVPIPTRRKLST